MYKFLMTTGKQHQEWKNENNFNPILCEQAVSSVFKSPSYDTRLYFPSLLFLWHNISLANREPFATYGLLVHFMALKSDVL
jgi:hypothetical protein